MRMHAYDEAKSRLAASLSGAGFDFARPRPVLAWAVFKRFVREQSGIRPGEVGFECWYDHTRDDHFRLSLACRLTFSDDVLSVELRCTFTRPLTDDLLPMLTSRWSLGGEDLDRYFDAVEGLPEFRTCMGLVGWTFEIE